METRVLLLNDKIPTVDDFKIVKITTFATVGDSYGEGVFVDGDGDVNGGHFPGRVVVGLNHRAEWGLELNEG